jgi:hypothetical protein
LFSLSYYNVATSIWVATWLWPHICNPFVVDICFYEMSTWDCNFHIMFDTLVDVIMYPIFITSFGPTSMIGRDRGNVCISWHNMVVATRWWQ